MSTGYDVIVVGLGSMGAATAYALASRGLRVLGLEAFGPAHDRGSMHGGSRIIRQAYFESPAYVPLLQRAYAGWRSLEEESGRDLLRLCGGLYLGDPASSVFTGSLAAAQEHGLDHEVIDAAEIRRRFPTMNPADHALGVYEAAAGYVRPEETVLANLDLATEHGADLRFHEPVTGWTATDGGGVEVLTAHGRYGADRLVLAPGAWATDLLADRFPLAVERQIFSWVEPDFSAGPGYRSYAEGHPIYIESTDGNGEFYGFPMIDGPEGGLKLAYYRQNDGATTTPQAVDRTVHPAERQAVLDRARQLFPHLTGRIVSAATCLYTSAPDDTFVIGPLPDTQQVVVAIGFSGHGFKFVPVIGEIAADLAERGTTDHDISLFALDRPALARS